MRTTLTLALLFLLAPGTRAEEAAVTLKPAAAAGVTLGSAFSFSLGIRNDAPDAGKLSSPYDFDLQYVHCNGDEFLVVLVTDDRSRIKDLGAMAWADLKEIPALTPLVSLDAKEILPIREGHLYLVHTKDTRVDSYAAFRVEKLVPGDHCDLTWKRVASPPPLEAPVDPKVSREGKVVKVSWKPCKGAKGYRILGRGEPDPLAETPECSATLQGLDPDSVYPLRILAFYATGEVSEEIPFEVHTHPPEWKSGVFELSIREQGYSFTQGRRTDRGPKAEFLVVDSGGMMTSLTFKAPGGLARSETRGCSIPEKPPYPFAERYRADSRCPASESFLVRTPEGGLASLLLLERDYPKLRFLYLCRPAPPSPPDPVPLDAEAEAGIRKLIARLDAPTFEEREKAFAELVRIGPRARKVVDEALKSGTSAEVLERLESWRAKFSLGDPAGKEIDGAAEMRHTLQECDRDGGW